jgi:IS5 family transposase
VELATDTRSGLVVGVDVINVGSDSGQLRPMAEQIERRFGAMPRRMLVDGNFAHLDDIEHLGGTKAVDVIAPIKNEATQKAQGSDPYQPKRRDGPAVVAWRMRMGTPAAQQAYKRRASTAEWVNARLRNMGLRQFVVRGLRKVRAVSTLFALAHNLMQLRTRRWAHATG